MRDGFEAVVDVEGRHHHEESVGVDRADEGGNYEGIPGFVRVVGEGVTGVGEEKGDRDHIEIFECYSVVFFGFFFGFRKDVFVFKGNSVGDQGVGCRPDTNVHHGSDFPEFDQDTHTLTKEDEIMGKASGSEKKKSGATKRK